MKSCVILIIFGRNVVQFDIQHDLLTVPRPHICALGDKTLQIDYKSRKCVLGEKKRKPQTAYTAYLSLAEGSLHGISANNHRVEKNIC